MIRGVGMAARFLGGLEFHELDACEIGIVGVKRPFSVPSNFRAVKFLQSVLVELFGSAVNVSHAQRKMILYAEILAVGVCRNVQHVFDPVVAVRDLDFVPVDAIVLEAAIPIQPEAKKVDIEAIFSGGVFNDKPGVK